MPRRSVYCIGRIKYARNYNEKGNRHLTSRHIYSSLTRTEYIPVTGKYAYLVDNAVFMVKDGEWETLDWKGRSGVPDVLHIDPLWMSKPVIDYSQSGHPDLRRFGSCNLRIRTGRDDIGYAAVQKNVGQQKRIYLDY